VSVTIAANEKDVYPVRIQIVVEGLTLGDDLAIFRVVAGQRTAVRGGTADDVTDTAYVTTDAELPFGVPVSYVAVVNGTTEYTTSVATHTLAGGKVAVTDAISGQAVEVVIVSAGPKQYARDSVRLRPAGRNVVVTGPAGQAEGSYQLYVETAAAREDLLALLGTATEATIQLRQPGGYPGYDAYLTVDAWTEDLMSDDGSDQRRLITINWAETDGWADELTARGTTYQELIDFYATGTYADLVNDYAGQTYLDLIQADFS
jgi:hypothetical protein